MYSSQIDEHICIVMAVRYRTYSVSLELSEDFLVWNGQKLDFDYTGLFEAFFCPIIVRSKNASMVNLKPGWLD